MILTLIFLGATLFFAKRALKAREENGKLHWPLLVCTAAALVISILVAVKPWAN
ncbi:MAG: hypothetical protein JKY60_07645 [Kordiimonadaceae bacterium]|nr:hypothetical protein [Kordiimonadaceae bacterium]